MTETVALATSVLVGTAVGTLFFGGLWWTVQRVTSGSSPPLFFLLSYVVRLVVVGTVIFIFRAHWGWLTAGLFGFIVAREFMMRRLPKA